ncbi:hypothetical protein C8E02_3451 [Vogesella indigofera]|uniref:DUF2867 domain-containing protein n=1 Tax=Vogesella indigofera TaxID=45465 RepID=A0A495AW86_VOGIN|nr:hypothetical protein [Vogesella indigofera]RKQ52981.1 hypothetical protein C8E02_3451 [Vogesella indigofera]
MSPAATLLPDFQFRERHQRQCRATPAALIAAVPLVQPQSLPLVRVLLQLRELPARLLRDPARQGRPLFGLHEFTLLYRDEHSLALGLAGRFWQRDFGLASIADADGFRTFAEPGVPRLLLTFQAQANADGSLLCTETRVHCPDHASRLRFWPYWLAIRLASGLIRRQMLAAIEQATGKPD